MAPKRKEIKGVVVSTLQEAMEAVYLRPVEGQRELLVNKVFPRQASSVFALVEPARPRWKVRNSRPLHHMVNADATLTALRMVVLPSLLIPRVQAPTLDLVEKVVKSLRVNAGVVGGAFENACVILCGTISDLLKSWRAHPGKEDPKFGNSPDAEFRDTVDALIKEVGVLQDREHTISRK